VTRRLLLASIAAARWLAGQSDKFVRDRDAMVRDQMEARDVRNPAVLAALRAVPRHLFVPPGVREYAYSDRPLPIEHGQTISQPYIVAIMTQLLEVEKQHRVLEIGTGSGYQAAVLSKLVKEVYSLELEPELAREAIQKLRDMGYSNVFAKQGDGYQGWPEKAPFDRIMLTAAPPKIPQPLIDQLKPGGKLVAPEGERYQVLVVIDKGSDGRIKRRTTIPVMFVPMRHARPRL
jgi:protein-L-isoaspartate(D-aspartate) O-methyltransferase